MTTLSDLKVIRHYGPNDVDAIYDGEYLGSFRTRQEAQRALDDHALSLIQDGLVDQPLATLDAPTMQPCIHCGDVQERASCDACVEWGEAA